MFHRAKGKLHFLDVQDRSGKIQILASKSQLGEDQWKLLQCFDLGDIIGVDGEVRRTKAGEISIFADKLHFLTKSPLDSPGTTVTLAGGERSVFQGAFRSSHVLSDNQEQ